MRRFTEEWPPEAPRGTLCGRSRTDAAGFTLVELLVVIAIIGIIVAIVVPVAMGARRTTLRMREVAALRTVLTAWTSYATEQKGWLLPGYRTGFPPRLPNGEFISPTVYGGDVEVGRRYPWRLAPYLSDDFRSLYTNENEATLQRLANDDPQQYYYFASLYPSFGMNSAWVGGDEARFPCDSTLPNGATNPLPDEEAVGRLLTGRARNRLITLDPRIGGNRRFDSLDEERLFSHLAAVATARGEAIGAVRPDGSVGWPWLLFGHTHLPMLSPLDATGSPVRYANSGTSLLDHALTSIEWDPARREPRLVVWTDEPDGPRRRELIADGAHLAVLDDA